MPSLSQWCRCNCMQSEIKHEILRLLNLKIDQNNKRARWGNYKDLFTLNVSYCSHLFPSLTEIICTLWARRVSHFWREQLFTIQCTWRFSLGERVRARSSMPVREVSPLKFHLLHVEVSYAHVKIKKSRWNTCIQHESTDVKCNHAVFLGSHRWQREIFFCKCF